MNIGEILIWESFNLLLLFPVVIGFYLLRYGLGWFVGALLLAGVGVFLIACRNGRDSMPKTGPF